MTVVRVMVVILIAASEGLQLGRLAVDRMAWETFLAWTAFNFVAFVFVANRLLAAGDRS